jgi:fibronectin type 3 domain-containing protein
MKIVVSLPEKSAVLLSFRCPVVTRAACLRVALGLAVTMAIPSLLAHPITFNSTITYSTTQPGGASGSVSSWTGAAFDAANIGGSGTNADGSPNNGAANDASTYVSNNRPVQGQTFTTGSNANGYDVTGVTARMTGYTNNTATGSNGTAWNMNATNGPIIVTLGRISGTTQTVVSMQNFTAGGTGNPGSGQTANGPGTYITFNLPFPVHLDPNTTYSFDFIIGNGGSNYFEWLGTSTDPYSGGTAYTRSGNTITPLSGDRVFLVNMTASATAYAPFVHPGALHTQADLDRMKAKVAAGTEPWKTSYDTLANSPWAQTWWPAYDVDYIVRGSSGNNYTRSQQDAQAIYELALRWKITGDTAYADHAVAIANVWSGLLGVTGDTNSALAAGICGYLFASGGEILSTYPGWNATDKQAYKDMMMRVFYPANFDFLWRHFDTFWRTGGNTHYRLNWDTDNMASMAAIGILCDNKAVYQQAVDYFKSGSGNGQVQRAAWYVHPDGMAQTEEVGRDQGHNLGGWYSMGLLCQMAWNQGDDLYGYDNNRVLRAFEMNAKYNLFNDVRWVFHRNSDLGYTETISGAERGNFVSTYEQIYNHYVNVKGIAAPYSKAVADLMRPEPRPDPNIHPSQVDWFGLGGLTFARDPISAGVAPSGLMANWSRNQVMLYWWGSAYATSYLIKRSATIGGPYTQVGTATALDTVFTDPTVTNGGTYYYIVTAVIPGGNLDSAPLLVSQALKTQYTFENNTNDAVGTRNATAMGGTSAPGYAAGFSGQAISLNGSDQYVQLPVGSGNYQDITIAAWVYWNGGGAWQRVFDFGSEIEKYMMLTVKDGSGKLNFSMTTSRGTDGSVTLVGPTMPTATWTHVAITLNGDTATMYVNGLPVAATTAPSVDPLFGQPFCYLGRSMWNADPDLNGRIDDFRIYNYGLTGSAIYSLWGQGGTNVAPVFTTNPMTKAAASQGAAYTGQTIAATDANGGTLTYAKVTGPAWLSVSSTGALTGTPGNGDVGKNTFVVRVTDSSGATDDANLYITVNNVNDAPTWSGPSLTKLTVSVGQAYLTASLAGDASDVDSAYGDTVTFSKVGGPSWLTVASNGALSGTPGASDAGTNTFTVRVTDSNGATADVTLTITVLPSSLRAHYNFESSANDDLGNLNGTISGTATYAAGRYGNGLVFDGSSTYVTLPANAADYQDITVAAWVNWNGGGAWQRIFDFGNGTSQYLMLTPSNGSTMQFGIVNGSASHQITAPALPTGQWTHVAVTLKGGTATLYVNGVPVGVNNAITISPGDFKPASNYIGKSQFADPLFNGTIDSFRIYNYALDAATIQTIAADGVTHLKFDESSGAAAADATGNNWGGTLVNGPLWSTSGRINNAVDLDGGNDTVSLPAGIVNGLTTATIATWVNLDTLATWPRIFDFGSGSVGATTGAYMFLSPKGGSGRMRFAITTSGYNNEQAIESTSALPTGGWHHVAVVLNGSSGTLYVDGVQAGQNTAMTLNPSSLGATTQNYLGKSQYNDPYLDGRIDDFRILGRALTAAEVSALAGTMAAPGSPAVTAGNAQVGLTWSAVTGATGYVVRRSTTNGGPYTTLAGAPGGTSFTDATVTNGTTYYYVIAGANSLGEGIATAQLTATPVAAAPAAPTGLTANGWNGPVQLAWTASVGATSYDVLRSTTNGSGYSTIASGLTSPGYTDSTATDGVTYYYVVTAANSGGASANSAQVSTLVTRPRVSLKLDDGAGTTAADASGNGWTGTLVNGPLWVAGRSGNALWFDGSNDHVTLPTGVVNGLSTATISFWADLDSVSNWARFFDFGTGTTVNMFLTPKNGATGVVRFALTTGGGGGEQQINGTSAFPVTGWHHVAVTLNGAIGTLYVDGAQVGQNTGMTLTPTSLGATTQNRLGRSQYNDPYLAGRLDEFRVYGRAFTSTEVASVMAGGPGGLAAPTGITATAAVGQITVSWTAAAGATGYEVLRSTASGGPYVTVATNVSGTSNTNAGLPSATTYYYVVVAHNATSESMNSSAVSATTP